MRDVLRQGQGANKDADEEPASAAGESGAAGTGGDDWVLPDLYSLRRSPYYQRKITQRQLNAHILNTRTSLITQLTTAAKSEYDLRLCLEKLREQNATLGNVKRSPTLGQDGQDKKE